MRSKHPFKAACGRALILNFAAFPVLAAILQAVPSELPVVEAPAMGRKALSLVLYQQDLALVRDTRTVDARKGRFEVIFPEVPEQLIPGSVLIEAGEGFKVLEQRHDPGALNVHRLLEDYLGREITFERLDKRTETLQARTGTLLGLDGGRIVRFGDRVEIDPEGTLILPGVPAGLSARPSLVWQAEASKDGSHQVETSYLTRGVDWSCEYVLSLPEEGGRGALTGWVSIDNRCGVDFPDCRLTLVAGQVNVLSRPEPPQRDMGLMMAASRAEAKESADFAPPQALSEYYRYDLGRTTTVARFGASRIELLRVPRLEVETKYRLRGDQSFYFGPAGQPQKNLRPELLLEWTNGGAGWPGMPLPAGLVRVYRRTGGQDIFVGEDRIGHTPRDEKLRLAAGLAFDIAAERRQVDFRRLSDRLREVTVEVRVRNHKDRAVTVEVHETMPGDWKMIKNSHPFEKADASTIRFSPLVPASGEITLTYTAQFM